MPVYKVAGGYRWGKTGKVYKTREEAERQGRAAYMPKKKSKSRPAYKRGPKKVERQGRSAYMKSKPRAAYKRGPEK